MKRLLGFVCVLGLLLSCGCSGGAVRLPAADYTVEFTEEYFFQGAAVDVKLAYPAVSGLKDEKAADALRSAAKAYACARFEEERLTASGDVRYAYSVNDTKLMLAAPGFLSVVIGGVISADSGGVRYFAYTFNYDLTVGAVPEAAEIFSDYGAIRALFEAGRFRQDFGYSSLAREVSFSDLIAQYRPEYGVYPPVYFSEGRLGFLVETVPSLDGYAGFSIDIRQVRDLLRTDNPVIAMLCGLSDAQDS